MRDVKHIASFTASNNSFIIKKNVLNEPFHFVYVGFFLFLNESAEWLNSLNILIILLKYELSKILYSSSEFLPRRINKITV